MELYRSSKKDLYKFGLSQPPWLLAVRGRYQRLGPEWNCRGLGREFLDAQELAELRTQGFDQATLKQLKVKRAGSRSTPYVAPCAAGARLLHFNGRLKPWKRRDWQKRQLAPLCSLPRPPAAAAALGTVRQAHGMQFAECTGLWWAYLSEPAARALDLRSNAQPPAAPGSRL